MAVEVRQFACKCKAHDHDEKERKHSDIAGKKITVHKTYSNFSCYAMNRGVEIKKEMTKKNRQKEKRPNVGNHSEGGGEGEEQLKINILRGRNR